VARKRLGVFVYGLSRVLIVGRNDGGYDSFIVLMQYLRKKSRRSGFTLIELLTVIGIIGILVAILIPAGSRVMDSARKATAASNLRQIALAYNMAVSDSGSGSLSAKDIHSWIATLGTKAGLDDPRLWMLKDDSKVIAHNGTKPSKVGKGANEADDDFKDCPISFSVASGLSADSPKSTTPLAWTRGLESSGKWGTDGVYGEKGGHVVFLDGHVEWFEDLSQGNGLIVDYKSHSPTQDIQKALSPGASILSSK